MNQAILDKLAAHFDNSESKTYHKGHILTHAGEEPAGISWLQDGVVEQYDVTPEGNKVTVNIYKPPAFFPMSWAINRMPNDYFFAALTEVTIKRADATATVAFLKANPEVLFDLLSRVYRGTDALLRRQVVAASGLAATRLVFELLIEAYRFGTDMDNGCKLITIKQNTLAARSGLARETVSRELHKLAAAGSVELTKSGLLVHAAELEKKLNSL